MMISPAHFFESLQSAGFTRFTGVPDSLLKEMCAYITDKVDEANHIIAANEGNAIGLAAGWYLGTGSPAVVYMQNSGLGNTINPLASLCDPDVYGIPMLLVIGWRGEPGTEDEPQHIKQGRITTSLLDVMEIPYFILGPECKDITEVLFSAKAELLKRGGPVALVVRSGTFSDHKQLKKETPIFEMSRERAIKLVVDSLDISDIVISTTGKTSRELYEYRLARGTGLENDFLTVGSMGHASSIAMGVAMTNPHRKVFCFDGDGAVVMHMGAMAIIAQEGPKNLVHIVFNNGSHDSVGGQPTVGLDIDLVSIAKSCGYRRAESTESAVDVPTLITEARNSEGPTFIEIKVNKGARKELGRPKNTPRDNCACLMRNISEGVR